MKRILIVDDKEENRYYLEALLKGNGYEVDVANHGAEALLKARCRKPDCIISDLLMPVMDGYTLLRRWKADPSLGVIPFIVYTATYTEPEDEKLALNLGADAFILKPAEPEDFLAQLKRMEADYSQAGPEITRKPEADNPELLKVYSEALIRKLEEKTFQLEASNKKLESDIEHRKQIEQSLRESEERFRQLAENINEVFWISDPEKRNMLYVSPAFEAIWGKPCEQLYESPACWMESVHAEDRDRVASAAMTQQVKGLYEETYRIVRSDESIRWIHDKAFPVRNQDGEVYRIVGIASDITERRQLEQQFLRSQRMESIGTLAGGIAHDLNNLLSPIIMGVDLLRRMVNDPKIISIIDNIGQSARRGGDLVKQVLSFARGVEGAKVSIQLSHLLREVESIILNSFPKNIRFEQSIPNDLWTVVGDATQLNQVLLNLCVNARDAIGENSGRLSMRASNQIVDAQYASMDNAVIDGDYVLIEITDDGCGMNKETLERIFEPFFTTKPVGKGTGLGLSSACGIIRSHGGFIRVISEPGRGSTFKVYLPAQERADRWQEEETQTFSGEKPRGAGECILVVDDEVSVLTITKQTLEAYGYRVIMAEDGAQAISVYVEHKGEVDLVLTDLMMPEMDGAALLAVLLRLNPKLKVVAASGLNTGDHVAKVTRQGVRHFLSKPYSADRLLDILKTALSE